MYFITKQDPNYIIKGSRDPLGFQVIWQSVARKLIPNLSTVSNSVIDFQIMSMAHYTKESKGLDEATYRKFFSRMEKLFGYVRYYQNPKFGFNGVDKIRKLSNSFEGKVYSISDQVEILSNQRAYGIWGKYNRPFQDCGITNDSSFHMLMKEKIDSNTTLNHLLNRLLDPNPRNTEVTKDEIQNLAHLIHKPSNKEKEIYTDHLLCDNIGNHLLTEFKNNPELQFQNPLEILNIIHEKTENEILKNSVDKIIRTEKILCPLNRVFRHLQSKPSWSRKEIEDDNLIASIPKHVNPENLDEKLSPLYQILQRDNLGLVEGLLNQNRTVCEARKSSPWMEFSDDRLDVNMSDGGYPLKGLDTTKDFDNTCFLDSYSFLYRQLN